MADIRFEEKILYKTRQHWIVPVIKSFKAISLWMFVLSFLVYFMTSYSWIWTLLFFCVGSIGIGGYYWYLWAHSWLMIGNQKITMTVRSGFFSQYAMNIRYRNIRDCAVSKNNILNYIFKYGTLFIRSSGAEGDFEAHFAPKVGKIYALINALSRYSDDERTEISSIEKLHNHHQKQEFSNIDHTVQTHG